MKVQTIEPAGFKPITLSITIESKEELRAIQEFTGWNVSSVDALVEGEYLSKEYSKFVTELFGAIYENLQEQE